MEGEREGREREGEGVNGVREEEKREEKEGGEMSEGVKLPLNTYRRE